MKLSLLNSADFIVFSTREYAGQAGVSLATASRQLKNAAAAGVLARVTRGIWANTSHPYFDPVGCVPKLLGNEHGYVSFLTALHLHGALSQIPAAIQIATTGHGRVLATPVGKFEFFRIMPSMMRDGIEWTDTHVPYRLANVEKAFLDTLYLSTRKGRRFQSLPELDFSTRTFSRRRFAKLLSTMENRSLAAAIEARAKVTLAA